MQLARSDADRTGDTLETQGTASVGVGLPARVGPFYVVRERSRVPGSTLVEARDADGERRLLQLARFRAPTDEVERGERQRLERQIAQRTAELVMGADVVVHAHGGADGERGERFLFWALPYSDAPTLAERAERGQLQVAEVLRAGAGVAARLVGRHQKQRCDARLSEQIVHLDDRGEVAVLGVPLGIDGGWLAQDLPKLCFAPEEEGDRVATPAGDVWRLGQLLLRLAKRIGAPASVEAGLLALTDPDPTVRIGTAQEAEDRLRKLADTQYESEETTQAGASNWEAPTESSDPPLIQPAPPKNGSNGHAPAWPDAPVSGQLAFNALIDFDSARARALEALSNSTLERAAAPSADPDAVTRESTPMAVTAPMPISSPTTPLDSRPPTTVREEARSVLPIPELVTDPTAPAPRSPDQAAIEALAASWSQTVLPPGESPWSEVVSPRGTHTRARESFPGLAGELPVLPEPKNAIAGIKRDDTVWDEPPPPAPVYRPVDSGEIEAEIAAAISGFDTKKVVAAVLAVLVIFGVFALIARSGDQNRGENDLLVAPAANEFLLESEPPAATVVAEADGRILGKTPLRFQVPAGGRSGVYLVLSGHEPIRIDLPERGGIKARLSRIDQPECELSLTAVDGTPFEGVDVALGPGAKVVVPGAAVVRPKDGSGMEGARLVLCPSLGGEPSVRLRFDRRAGVRTVRITEPAGSAAYLNGEPVGRVPAIARATTAFSAIRVDDASGMSEERFVPTTADVEVRMPAPHKRKRPTLVVPDDVQVFVEDEPENALLEGRPAGPKDRTAAVSAMESASRFVESGKLDRATEAYRSCLAADPGQADCHLGLGNLYQKDRRPRKARAHYLRFLELAPDAPDAARVKKLIGS
jgi:hypothetical protein